MALICCLDVEPGCICKPDKTCGGIHLIDSQCVVHARVTTRCKIHEIGARRIEVVQ